jgi:hypothetical protein
MGADRQGAFVSRAVPLAVAAALAAVLGGCQRMSQPPAHGTIRARSVEVFLDGLRPTLVSDLRVEVIGAPAGATYDLGPAFDAQGGEGDGGSGRAVCLGGACTTPVDAASELYPVEVRYLLDELSEAPEVVWPLRVRFELRELRADGAVRVVAACDPRSLDEACARLGRVPLELRQTARLRAGAEGELTVQAIQASAGCEGPVLHVELAHRVMPLPGTAPVVRLAVGFPGFAETACRGQHCEVPLEPPDRGTAVIDKPLGACFAALGRPTARAQIHLYLERRPVVPPEGGAATGDRTVLDHYVFDLISPGAGVVP